MKKNNFAAITFKTKIISIFLLAGLMASFGCRSKTVVKKLAKTDSTINSKTETRRINGLLYHLPLTIIKVSVPFKMKKESPGEFSDFTPCFFDEDLADRRIKVEKKTVTVGDPEFSQTGIADLEETYVVKTTGDYFESRTIAMTMNEEGVLTEGSYEIKDERLPIAIKIAETAISLGVKAATFQSESQPKTFEGLNALIKSLEKEKPEKSINCYLKGFEFQVKKLEKKIAQLVTDSNETGISASKKAEILKNKNKLEQEHEFWDKRKQAAEKIWSEVIDKNVSDREYLPFVISFRNARQAKAELDRLSGARELLQGDLQNIAAHVYKARLKEMDDKIKELTDKFFGTEKDSEWTGKFKFNPAKNTNGINHKRLLVYSKSNGICYDDGEFKKLLADDGIVPLKDIRFDQCTGRTDLTKIQIYADRLPANAAFISQVSSAKLLMRNQTSGWYFRVPAKATIGLIECKNTSNDARCQENMTEFGRDETMIAQYGAVISLPAKTAGRSSSISVTLDPTTGMLKNFKASSSPVADQSMIENAGKIGDKILDAADPLTKKKRELEALELENKINAERKKLESPSPSPTPEEEEPSPLLRD